MSSCQNIGIISESEIEQRYTKIKVLGSGAYAGIVYQAINNQQIVALKISFRDDIEEIYPSCNYESILKLTESIVSVYEYGIIKENNYLFYTMPILYQVPEMTSDQQLDFIFEFLYTLVVLAQHGISHNDLHTGNILCKMVPYKRQYIINDQRYIVSSNILPVIIDFGEVDLDAPTDRFSEETVHNLTNMEPSMSITNIITDEKILNPLVDQLKVSDRFDILFHPIFNSLRHKDIQAGDMIKVFEALNL